MFFNHVVVVADECDIVLVGFLLLVCWLGGGCVWCGFGGVLSVAVRHEHSWKMGDARKLLILMEWVVIWVGCRL